MRVIIAASDRSHSTAPAFSSHLISARRISSSYNVHASAELRAFLPMRNPSPSNKLLKPSSFTIWRLAQIMLPYLPGMSCKRVLMASNGFVMVVAIPAASTPEKKLMGTDVLLVIFGGRPRVSIGTTSCSWLRRFLHCS